MPYRYEDERREEYYRHGYTLLQDLIPAALLADLRRETDRARELARKVSGPQAQRLQPVYAYPELDHRPFRDFLALPEFVRTAAEILGTDHAASDIMGVLIEPAQTAWSTMWHRDWLDNVPGVEAYEFHAVTSDISMFNQFNAALYDDASLWVVPGSDRRAMTEAEAERFPSTPAPGPPLTDDMSEAERELTVIRYARSMPGAVRLCLAPGDVAFYRSSLWHLGTYTPGVRRATLHDGIYGPKDLAWQQQAIARAKEITG